MYSFNNDQTNLPIAVRVDNWARLIRLCITVGGTVTLTTRPRGPVFANAPWTVAFTTSAAGNHDLSLLRDNEYKLTIAGNTGNVSLSAI